MSLPLATRRRFLTQGLGLIGVGSTLPLFLVRTALAGPAARSGERILVVVQQSGGHDGLSALVPYASDDYARNRTATRIPAAEVIRLNDEVGLHPNLKGLHALYEKQMLAIVQGVGYPNPNRSHFRSMDIWHYADTSSRPISAGWLGRYCDQAFPGVSDPALTLAIGGDRVPRAIQGKGHPGLALQRPEAYRFLAERQLGQTQRKLSALSQDSGSAALQFVARTAVAANESSQAIQQIAGRKGSAVYPTSPLAASLQTVAALIAGGLSTRVYYVFQGGYDTHAGQKQRHDRLMTELADALAAFQKDLVDQGNAQRVLTMTFSEFGRRVRENGSQGTDHGAAGPMFLIGPGVKPGLFGKQPSLAAADLENGDLRHNVDFRGVYATVLESWLSTPSQPVLGERFAPVPCLA